ncbi:MAG: SOS response-associated peptidase [Clostridia bacterium]|jgi:putative SOS response-associated peptidase YedK|nr:SOS response-associated peptidase [Clostridia bacterium]MBT7123235.1 SOS response-associated peptidase [Clostridia bacterium]
MCGRYSFDDTREIYEVRALLAQLAESVGEQAAASVKLGEVFPTDTAAILAQTQTGHSTAAMDWGFPLHGSKKNIINARSETILEKPMFRNSALTKRCLVPCTGFYEWQKIENRKRKYKIDIKDENFFYLAGLYSMFKIDGEQTLRYVIITAAANDFMKEIHPRMPLIVPKHNVADWLNTTPIDIDSIYNLAGELEAVAV